MLGIDCVQLAAGLLAFRRAHGSSRAGAPSLARYARWHGALLAGGAVLLAVPVLLGLTRVISADTALIAALALEVPALLFARSALKSLEAAHQARRPIGPPAP